MISPADRHRTLQQDLIAARDQARAWQERVLRLEGAIAAVAEFLPDPASSGNGEMREEDAAQLERRIVDA